MCSYFTKDETECSQAIINAAKEAKTNNLSIAEGLRKIGAAFLSTREVSSQECVYRSISSDISVGCVYVLIAWILVG